MDVAHSEMVEKELDTLIRQRSRKEADPDEEHPLWKAQVERYNEQRRLQARAEWHLYHTQAAERTRRALQALVDYHEEQAEKLMQEGETT